LSRRPALFRQSDLMRAMRAAQRLGSDWGVDILPDGTIRCCRSLDRDWKSDPNPQRDGEWDNVR